MVQHVSVPEDTVEAKWEEFIQQNPRGQFQQSFRWAAVKALDGWRADFQVWPSPDSIGGGFLLLHKRSRFGSVGFVNKGPVLTEETPNAVAEAIEVLCRKSKALRLRALVLQPPDASKIRAGDMVEHGFLREPVPGIIDATALATVAGGPPTIEARMSRSARQNCRQAVKRGVEITEGTRNDLGVFFELMLGSCARQCARPNPDRVEVLEALWDAFASDVRLLFAMRQGEKVAGLLLIRFGGRCTFWKKGWNEAAPRSHANALLNFEAMVRAAEWGCNVVDFVGMDRRAAERWQPGQPMDAALGESRHAFNIRFGARPVVLSHAHVYLPVRVWRPVMGWLLRQPRLARRIERLLMK